MSKKVKEKKSLNGTDIQHLQGYDGWIKCTIGGGETFSISLRLLFDVFNDYKINLEKYGERWRAVGFYNLKDEN
jgi:hypothetical protein